MVQPDFHPFPESTRFSPIRQIGRGGMGAVYEVFDRDRGERVALKTLLRADPSGIARLKREFRALSGISHPHLVQLYELMSSGSLWFFTMELIDGVDFISYVRPRFRSMFTLKGAPECAPTVENARSSPAPFGGVHIDKLRHTLPQLVDALAALHAAEKLHRDIKPSNILVTADGRLLLLDFGLVADRTDTWLTEPTVSVSGTPAYMSPEQLANEPLSPASDWYSLGLVLYHALTGEVPHLGAAKHLLDLHRLRISTEPRAPSEVNPHIPENLDRLCLELLRAEPGERPTPSDIERLFDAVRKSDSIPAVSSSSDFVGRERELSELAEAFAESTLGKPVIVTIYGSSGMGKSALLQRFVDTFAGADRALVLRGRCYEQESVPYKALDSLVDELCRYWQRLSRVDAEGLVPHDIEALARLFPSFYNVEAVASRARHARAASEARELRRRAVAAFRELLLRMADRLPLVLVIDDLQWGDVDSAHLLGAVFRLPDPPPHLMLLSCRAEDRNRSPFLQAFFGAPLDATVRPIEMGPLSPEEAQQLAVSLMPQRENRALAPAIATEAAGSPFIVGELARFLSRRSRQEPDAPVVPPESGLRSAGPISPRALDFRLADVLEGRLADLPSDAQRVLEIVAIASGPIQESVAWQASGTTGVSQSVLAALRNGRLIRTTAGTREGVEIYHDRIRETVLRGIDSHQRREHHRHLANAMQASGASDPEELAFHFRAAGDLETAASYVTQAAEQAATALAFDRAARLSRLALDLIDLEDPRRHALSVRLAEALSNLGRSPESAEVYLVAAHSAGANESRQLRQRAAEQLLLSGHVDEGLAIIDDVMKNIGLASPKDRRGVFFSLLWLRLRLRLRGTRFRERAVAAGPEREIALLRIDTCWAVGLYLSSIDPLRGAYFQAYNLLLALAEGEPMRIARALSVEASYHSTSGSPRLAKAVSLLQKARTLSEKLDQPYLLGILNLAEGIVAFMAEERWGKCAELTARSESIFRDHCRAVTWELANSRFFQLNSLLLRGEIGKLASHLPSALKNAEDNGDLFAESFLRFRFQPLVWLAEDDRADKLAELGRLTSRLSAREFYLPHYWERHAAVQRALYAGEGHEALALVQAFWPRLRRSLIMRMQFHRIDAVHLRARCYLATAARTAGSERAPLLERARSDARHLEKEGTRRGAASSHLIEASIAWLEGDREQAATWFYSAADAFDACGMALHAAAARFQYGRVMSDERGDHASKGIHHWMQSQGILVPERMANMLAPGPARG